MKPQKTLPTWGVHVAGGTLVLALTGAGLLLGVRPVQQRSEELRAVAASINETDERARSSEQSAARLIALKDQLDDELRRAVRLLPANRVNERLSEITTRAESHGLTVEQIVPGAPTVVGRFVAVSVRIGGACGYPDVTSFLGALHEEYRDLAVTGLQITGQPGQPDQKTTYTVDFVWYAESAASAGASPRPE